MVDIAPVQALKRPVTLAEIKASKAFASFPLTRLPRLSVMPVSDAEWKEIERMSTIPEPTSEHPLPAPLRALEHVLPFGVLALDPAARGRSGRTPAGSRPCTRSR